MFMNSVTVKYRNLSSKKLIFHLAFLEKELILVHVYMQNITIGGFESKDAAHINFTTVKGVQIS